MQTASPDNLVLTWGLICRTIGDARKAKTQDQCPFAKQEILTTSRLKQKQQIVRLSIRAPLQDQSNGNKSYILAAATDRTSPLSRPRNLNESNEHPYAKMFNLLPLLWSRSGAPMLRCTICCACFGLDAKTYDLLPLLWFRSGAAMLRTSRPKQRQQIVRLRIGALRRDQSDGNKSFVLALGHHFETKAMATNRTSLHRSATSRLSNGNKSYILELAKATATNPSFLHWAPLRDQSNGNRSYLLH